MQSTILSSGAVCQQQCSGQGVTLGQMLNIQVVCKQLGAECSQINTSDIALTLNSTLQPTPNNRREQDNRNHISKTWRTKAKCAPKI
jgi:hypothetical protein